MLGSVGESGRLGVATAPELGKEGQTVCIGILASDPLRSIGLQSILEDGLKVRTVILPDDARPRNHKLNVLIVDQNFDPQHGGATGALTRTLLHMPGVAVVMLVRDDAPFTAEQMLAAGARGILPETAQIAEIRACIRAVLKGRIWTPRERAGERAPAGADAGHPRLANRFTPKEREVMHWLAQGHSNREIATTMGIDEATVKAHLGRMLRKAQASNRVELTLRALAEERAGAPVTSGSDTPER